MIAAEFIDQPAMTSRTDHRPSRAADTRRRSGPSRKTGFGGTLLGIFIGVAMGLALAAGVAFYLLKAGNSYLASSPARELPRETTKDAAKAGRSDAGTAEKPRFDFYKILPGVQEPKVQAKSGERSTPDRATVDRAASPDKAVAKVDERAPSTLDKGTKVVERYWLQAGSFASEIRSRKPEGAPRVRRLGGRHTVGEPARQGCAFSRPARSLRQYRRARPDEERARQTRLRRRGDQILR